MKQAYLSATLSALCFVTLGTCVTAAAASRLDPLVAPISAAPKANMTEGKRSLPMLQTMLGQWTTKWTTSSSMRYSSNLNPIAQPGRAGQAYRVVKAEQTASMQTPLNWLNAMTLKLTANRQVLAEFLDMTGHDLGSEWISEKDRSQPQK